jgi:hypothetical protein
VALQLGFTLGFAGRVSILYKAHKGQRASLSCPCSRSEGRLFVFSILFFVFVLSACLLCTGASMCLHKKLLVGWLEMFDPGKFQALGTVANPRQSAPAERGKGFMKNADYIFERHRYDLDPEG